MILKNEKTNEEERERLFNTTNDPEERRNLEKLIEKERLLSSQRIIRINQ